MAISHAKQSALRMLSAVILDQRTILVKSVGALEIDCAKHTFHAVQRPSLALVAYMLFVP